MQYFTFTRKLCAATWFTHLPLLAIVLQSSSLLALPQTHTTPKHFHVATAIRPLSRCLTHKSPTSPPSQVPPFFAMPANGTDPQTPLTHTVEEYAGLFK
jgi:hypothetical protein